MISGHVLLSDDSFMIESRKHFGDPAPLCEKFRGAGFQRNYRRAIPKIQRPQLQRGLRRNCGGFMVRPVRAGC